MDYITYAPSQNVGTQLTQIIFFSSLFSCRCKYIYYIKYIFLNIIICCVLVHSVLINRPVSLMTGQVMKHC